MACTNRFLNPKIPRKNKKEEDKVNINWLYLVFGILMVAGAMVIAGLLIKGGRGLNFHIVSWILLVVLILLAVSAGVMSIYYAVWAS
jgi:uncharacterized membrane protein